MSLAIAPAAGAEPATQGSHFATGADIGTFQIGAGFGLEEFNEMLRWSSVNRVSDLNLESAKFVFADVGGDMCPVSSRPVMDNELDAIVRYIYGEHGTGWLKAGYDIDTAHEVRMMDPGNPLRPILMRYRINVTAGRAPGGDSKQMTIRTLPAMPLPLADLRIEKALIDNIRPRSGMFLVTGPTGSGKSTLLSSMIREIVEQPKANEKILEYSSPIEFVYDHVKMPSSIIHQSEVGRHLRPHDDKKASDKSLFAYAIRNALRRKPTIIMVGETRDDATMEAAMEAALTGHLLYSTMHTSGVVETLRRIVKFFPADMQEGAGADILETLKVCCTQLLFPKRGGGKVALREFVVFDETARRQLAKRPTEQWPGLLRNMMIEGRIQGQMMREAAWTAFERGDIERETFKQIVALETMQG